MTEKPPVALTDNEWRIMEILWEEEPRTLMQFVHRLKAETGWSKSTVVTMIGRMEAKGLLYYEEGGKARCYYAALSREQAALAETTSLLERVYRGSVGLLMNTLVQQRSLTRKEREELYAILQKAEEGRNGND